MEQHLKDTPYLLGAHINLADIAIFPFIRQFSMVDPIWFENSPFDQLKRWLNEQIKSDLFLSVMNKQVTWRDQLLEKK